jgi:hypothetical protein
MNAIEKIALKKLKESLLSAFERCCDENANRMQHERIFIRRDINEAFEVIKAIEENNEKSN